MPMENQVSITINAEDLDKIKQAVTVLNETLKPYLISLSTDQRRQTPKMGDGTVPFVSKAMDYAISNPEFSPPYMDLSEMEVDLNAADELTGVYRPLLQLIQQLDDSIMLSGSEACMAALAYYNTVKIAARMNVPGAKAIYDDLKKHFAVCANASTNGQSSEILT